MEVIMKRFQVETVFPGFPGKTNMWGLGWGACYLIRAKDDLILVDTGGPGMEPWLEKRLNAIGVRLSDITRVFLTHIHWDHANNAYFFPQAEFIFTAAELEFAKKKGDYAAIPWVVPFLESCRCHIVEQDGEEVFPGGRVVFVPGHTPGSAALILDNDGETLAFTGDSVKNRLDLTTCVASMNPDSQEEADSLRKIKGMADVIYAGHDGVLRLINGRVSIESNNDVSIVMPKGLLVNGQPSLTLHISENYSALDY